MSAVRRVVLAVFLFAGHAHAASPVLKDIVPAGGQSGQEVEVAFQGERLGDARGVLFYQSGIEAGELTATNDKSVKTKFKIAADCAPGEHTLRIWTASGISEVRTFFVGRMPVVAASDTNNDATRAQPIPLNVTVAGGLKQEETDWYSIEGKKGQRLTIEVEGMRLGRTMFDPWICVTKRDGTEIARNDDSSLFLQDPVLSTILPADGTYLVQIRDSAFGGNDRCHYRMQVTTAPQPLAVYPAGGQVGQELDVEFRGDPNGPFSQKIKLSGDERTQPVWAEQNGETASGANLMRVSQFPGVLEVEPNDDAAHATHSETALPLACNGTIGAPGDTDYFRFSAKKDETWDVNVYARRLRSPLDSVLQIFDAKGKQLATNDDSNGPDSYLRFKVPADGEYCVAVKDQLARGSSLFTYRIEMTPVKANVELALPVVSPQATQERQTVTVPRGNRYATMVRVKRTEFGGDLSLVISGLPEGLAMQPVPVGGDALPVIFEATPDATVSARLCDLKAQPVDPQKQVQSGFAQNIDLVIANPGNSVYYRTSVDKLAVAVTEEAPCLITIIEPKVPLVQNGAMNLKVVAERRGDFKGPIKLSMLYNPNGVGSQASVTIPEGQNEAIIPLSASGDATSRVWKIAVTGSADAGKGEVWFSTQLANLEVAPPFLTGQIERSKTRQGESAKIVCKLKQQRPFEGKAKVQLLNLPTKATAPDMEVNASDTEISFTVATEKTTPAATKKDLFCQVTIMKDGEPIVQNIGQGGVLRIDVAGEKVVSAK